ncbi:RodZ domain-containing protein [Virgibacillus soli]|uniref:Helix-turn-helix domain-containing protein n=1 Tax=Paracerasibacillus soli TaxID=480284 RepID=A0ABU5CPD4_9BACI|nr:RodZ domain-containing protein [Virgibacillus soli]MDY0408214.1 helix-turn-helix domain-containing protein [Virgibacillus soli]
MGIGIRLKEAREEKNISLSSLQETTKIQKRYLKAIEEENFSLLPGKFYARAFIREYAIAVGLNPEELLEEYKETVPVPDEEQTTQYSRIGRSRKDSNTKGSSFASFIPTIIVVLLIIGIAFAAWYFIMQKSGTATDEEDKKLNDNEIYLPNQDKDEEANDNGSVDEETTDENATTEEKQSEAEPKLVVLKEGTGSRPESTLALQNPGDKITVTLNSKDKVWLEVKNGSDERVFYDNLTTDQSPLELDMTGQDSMYFNIGNASNLSININGIDLDYPVDPNKFVTQKIWVEVQKETETE